MAPALLWQKIAISFTDAETVFLLQDQEWPLTPSFGACLADVLNIPSLLKDNEKKW